MITVPQIEILIFEKDLILANRWKKQIQELYRGELTCSHVVDLDALISTVQARDITAIILRLTIQSRQALDDLKNIHKAVASMDTEVICLAGSDEQQLLKELRQLGNRFAQNTNTAVSSQDLLQLLKKIVARKTGSFEPVGDHQRTLTDLSNRAMKSEYEIKGLIEKIEANSERIDSINLALYGGPGCRGLDSRLDIMDSEFQAFKKDFKSLSELKNTWEWISQNKLVMGLTAFAGLALALVKLFTG